jgi:hypothetical protein
MASLERLDRPHAGSRQRQIRTSQRSSVIRAKHGASCRTWTRLPGPARPTTPGHAASSCRTQRCDEPVLEVDLQIEDVHVGNIEDRIGLGAHQRAPKPHIE